MKEILVLTHGRDDCAHMVINHIKKMGGECTRFNTEEFQKIVKVTLDLSKSGELTGRYYFPEKIVDFENIGVVWNRRVHEPDVGNEFDDIELKSWALEESKWAEPDEVAQIIVEELSNPNSENHLYKFENKEGSAWSMSALEVEMDDIDKKMQRLTLDDFFENEKLYEIAKDLYVDLVKKELLENKEESLEFKPKIV